MSISPNKPVANDIPPFVNIYEDESNLDIRRYIGLFLSNWYWFVLALFIAGMLAYMVNNYSEKMYTVTASLLIKDDERGSDMTGME